MRKQVEVLKHHADPRPEAGDLARRERPAVLFDTAGQDRRTAHPDRAVVDPFEMIDAANERALARAAFADNRDGAARCHAQVDALEYRRGAKALA